MNIVRTRFSMAAGAALTALAFASLTFAINVAAAPTATPVEVGITKFAFAPQELTVAPGTKVVWKNHDETPHTVTSNDKTTFASKGLDTDDTYEHTFDGEGDFAYICTVHPFMTGVVHVRKR